MEPEDENHLQFLANEALIRRTAMLDFPVMLKGSFLTRQYMPSFEYRKAHDVDFVYLNPLADPEDISSHLNKWLTVVTEMDIYDGVEFMSFAKNTFWRRIDYAMSDDFPTVNTDLRCTVNGQTIYAFQVDVSFNIPVDPAPIPLVYRPFEGEPFWLQYTCPISLQVAWKLHQTLVRPRFKDIYDVIYLAAHADFDPNAVHQCLQAFVNECAADKIDPKGLAKYLNGEEVQRLDLEERFLVPKRTYLWDSPLLSPYITEHEFRYVTDNYVHLPKTMSGIVAIFQKTLIAAGITEATMARLPKPTRTSRG